MELVGSNNRENIITSIEEHLKNISRRVLEFDTTEEVIHYLTDMFNEKLNSDLIAVALIEEGEFQLKGSTDGYDFVDDLFPLPVNYFTSEIFEKSLTHTDKLYDEYSDLTNAFKENGIRSWFTVPIRDRTKNYGICIVGYEGNITLYEDAESAFNELGNFTAIALDLIAKNEDRRKTLLDLGWSPSPGDNLSENIEGLVSRVTTLSGRETKSQSMAVYLLDKENNNFLYYPSSYGYSKMSHDISIGEDALIEDYFPNVEKIGYHTISLPLLIDTEVVGILYGEKSESSFYSKKDLEVLQLYGDYFTTIFENLQHTAIEERQRKQIESLLNIQQDFMAELIKDLEFEGINALLGEQLSTNIFLFDRYFNPVTYFHIEDRTVSMADQMTIKEAIKEMDSYNNVLVNVMFDRQRQYLVNTISAGTERFGYLVVEMTDRYYDEWTNLIVDIVNNIYYLQFSRRKNRWDTEEKIKDIFVERLLKKEFDDGSSMTEYANVFQWDLSDTFEIACIDFLTLEDEAPENIVTQQTKRNQVFREMKQIIIEYNPHIFTALVDDQLVLFREISDPLNQEYNWEKLSTIIQSELTEKNISNQIMIGIGDHVNNPNEYQKAYEKAAQTVRVLVSREERGAVAYYKELGSYTVLNQLSQNKEPITFIKDNLQALYDASAGQTVDLFNTLRYYLENGGSITATADALFIHRSTLTYRLDKITDILEKDINDPNIQFDLRLAYKLIDLYEFDDIFTNN